MNVQFHTVARKELISILDYYRNIQSDLPGLFLENLESTIDLYKFGCRQDFGDSIVIVTGNGFFFIPDLLYSSMLSEKKIELIIQILRPYNPHKIGIFGSRSRRDHTAGSDLDLLVDLEHINLFELVELEEQLSEKLGVKVDLVTEASLSKYVRPVVEKEIRYIYEKDSVTE